MGAISLHVTCRRLRHASEQTHMSAVRAAVFLLLPSQDTETCSRSMNRRCHAQQPISGLGDAARPADKISGRDLRPLKLTATGHGSILDTRITDLFKRPIKPLPVGHCDWRSGSTHRRCCSIQAYSPSVRCYLLNTLATWLASVSFTKEHFDWQSSQRSCRRSLGQT